MLSRGRLLTLLSSQSERHPVSALLAKGLSLNYYNRHNTAQAITDGVREHRVRLGMVSFDTEIPLRSHPEVYKSYSK